MTDTPVVKILFKKNYLAMIHNIARGENHMFRNFFITVDGVERDALADGGLACGTVVSSVLYLQNSTLEFLKKPRWIQFTHARVLAVEKDMQENGWYIIDDLREGAVITWEAQRGTEVPVYGDMHFHMGFFIGNDRVISNGSNSTHMPREHCISDDGTRKIVRIWWHQSLDEE